MAIYLKFGDITGNVSAKGHEDWIECTSMSFAVHRDIPMTVGTQTNREHSHPTLSEFNLSKPMDDASPYLFNESTSGKSQDVIIHVTKTGTDQLESIVEYTLTAALVSSYSISTSGDMPEETFSIAYTRIEMLYVLWDEKHTKASQIPMPYDLATATSV